MTVLMSDSGIKANVVSVLSRMREEKRKIDQAFRGLERV